VSARACTSVKNQYNIITPPLGDFAKLATILGLGLLIVGLSYVRLGWIPPLLLIGSSIYFPIYWFNNYAELYIITMQGAMSILVFSHVYGVKYGQEYFAKMRIKKQFDTYLSAPMVEKLQKNPELLKLGGETKHMTFLFCDIRGFTPISEQYKTDPQGLTDLVNRFLTPMTNIIMDNEGTIDKYMGDCIMAFWNAPLDVEEQEKKACLTSVQMYEALEVLNAELESDGLLPINIGVGINSGAVVVGNMGSDQRFDYSVLGDAVNLAARLEGQTKGYGVKTIIGEETAKEIDDVFATLEIDNIAVKGKTEGVRIFTVLGEHKWWNENSAYVPETKQHDTMLELYRMQKFDVAIKWCNDLKGAFLGTMDDYYEIWIARCEEMKTQNLPKDWDGVYRPTTK
jgi:adenylate cyclase